MFDLKDKKVLITGSTQGIGLEIAKILSENKCKVFINGSSDINKVNEVVNKIESAEEAFCDISKCDCGEILYDKTGDVDILILNASVQIRKPWEEITDYDFYRQIDINLKASLKLMQKYVIHMKKNKWGRIITIGSVQQVKPHKDMIVYAATKCAQMSFVRSLATQLAPFNITINNIAPGVITTPRNQEALSNKEYEKEVLSNIPTGYAATPELCAYQALLLCSDEGKYITGQNIYIDGGMSIK